MKDINIYLPGINDLVMIYLPGSNDLIMIYLPGSNDLIMIYLPGSNDLVMIYFKSLCLGSIHLFWQAVPMINYLNGSYHSVN